MAPEQREEDDLQASRVGPTPGPRPFARSLSEPADDERAKTLTIAAVGIGLIALADFQIKPNVSLGFLYIVPILIASGFLARWQIVAVAAVCAVLREVLGPFSNDDFLWTREVLVFGGFVASGLLVREMVDGRRRSEEYSRKLEGQILLRQDAEEQLHIFVESNPAGILTLDGDRRILRANRAAARIFGCSVDEMISARIDDFLPDLARVPIDLGKRFFRTNMECTGRRRDGTLLAADVWFSTFETSRGPRLAAIVLDLTEEVREREDLHLDSVLTTSKVLVGAVLHEIRNLSAAARVAHANLSRQTGAGHSEDFQALGTLVGSLEKVASSELTLLVDREGASVELAAVLREFRLVAEPSSREADVSLEIRVEEGLRARVDRHSLLQVLLNLFRNSLRAMQDSAERRIRVSAECREEDVLLRFRDSGPGIESPEHLFQPFRPSAEATGLGLYVSRAILRSFGGELYYEPSEIGAEFVVRLLNSSNSWEVMHIGAANDGDQSRDHRRPQPVPPGA